MGEGPAEGTTVPLTVAQTGIWFAQALDPGNPIYTTGERVDLDGPLDVDAFAAAVRTAVDEADLLHVRVEDGPDGEPRQVLLPPGERAAWALEHVDLRGEADPEAAAVAHMRSALAIPAWEPGPDPSSGRPVVGQTLLRLGETHHVWFHRYHHLVIDAYGFSLIARRVAAVTAARAAG